MRTKTVTLVFLILLSACGKQVERNLNDWEGEWTISTMKDGEKDKFMEDFLENPWRSGEIVDEDYGTLTVDEDGGATFYFQNSDYSDTLLPITMKGYLHDYGDHHLEFYGLKVTASENPDFGVGAELCNDGNLVFWIRQNHNRKKTVEITNMFECGFVKSNSTEWFVFKKN